MMHLKESKRVYELIDLGLINYNEAFEIQKDCLKKVYEKSSGGFLLYCEHNPVFTLGRSASEENILINSNEAKLRGIEIIKTNRGGDVTFHGIGQLVAYPIFDLKKHYMDVHRFMRDIEKVVICSLEKLGIHSFRIDGKTGVWTEEGKIASIGLALSKWISYHGVAINLNVDTRYFDMIYPCGFKDIKITSAKQILKKKIDSDIFKGIISREFERVFSIVIANK
ncbi:MAG: lipoyl(octanoyl) transferase LipB [Candidatus Omnitrophota bacterium]